MRIAALYDIHANLPALEAVIADVDRSDLVVVGGDVVWGPWPQETMDLLRALPNVEFIMGNADRDVFDRVEGPWKADNDWCADRLSIDHLAFLASRPATLALDDVLYCHGSPRSDTETMTAASPETKVRDAFEGVEQPVVVLGHTHAQFDRTVDPWRIVNAGSVGNPFGERGHAYWARLIDGEPELRSTRYDVESAVTAMRATGWPRADRLADEWLHPAPASAAAEFFG